jgi:hypothetical protein
MLRSLTNGWRNWLPSGSAAPSRDRRPPRRRRTLLTVEPLEERACPATAIGDTITGVATLHSTDPNETGEGEPAIITNTTGSFSLSISAYEVPTPFQFKAAVVNDNVLSHIMGEDGDETVDVQIQVNGKNALTINQKEALNTSGSNVNIGSNVLWVVSGVCAGAAIYFTVGGATPVAYPACAALAGTLAGLTGLFGTYQQKQAIDPPDPHFDKIAQAKAVRAPHIKAGGPITLKLATALNNLLQNEAKAVSLLQTLTTTENRVSGAALAGNQKAVNKQLKVARKLRHDIAGLLLKDVSLRMKASAAFKGAHITMPGLTSSQVFNAEQTLSTSGPPATVLATLHALGVDDATIKQITSQFVVMDTQAVARASADPFADPTILASLRAAAVTIRQG